MNDGAEAAGMYDPVDPHHLLVILDFTNSAGNVTMRWIGKGGGVTNSVLWSSNLVAGVPTNVLFSAQYAGGSSPWYKATNSYTWAATEPVRFISVSTAREP